MGLRVAVGVATAMIALSGCAASPTAGGPSTPSAGGSSSVTPTVAPSSGSPAPTSASPSPGPSRAIPPAGAVWTAPAGSSGLATATVDGGRITLLWMDPTQVRFRFVPGTRWPEHSPVAATDREPATWTSTMTAAFNGGFKLTDHVGGYYYLGRTVAPLRAGLGTFTVDRTGRLQVGAWGRDLHLDANVVVVRQNLPLAIDAGRDMTTAHDPANRWGRVLGSNPHVNRSALGELSDGGLVFGVGHEVTAHQMALALAAIGVQNAMMLDMNPLWPTAFLYRHDGSSVTGHKVAPWIRRDPSIYLTRFKKDFLVVSPRTS